MATIFEFDMSTMREDAIAPDDEMLGMSNTNSIARAESHQPYPSQNLRSPITRRYFSNNNNNVSNNNKLIKENSRATTMDDEDRVPPPIDDIKATSTAKGIANSDSTPSEFYVWERERKQMLLTGTVATSSSKPKMNTVHLTDWKTNRLHKNRFEKELRRVKSDSSTATAPESSDEHSSSGASSQSAPLPASKRVSRRHKYGKSKGAKTPKKPFETVYVIREAVPRQLEPIVSQPQESHTMAPRSPLTTDRPVESAMESLSSAHAKANSTELDAIMVGLKELKTWVEGSSQPQAQKQPQSPDQRHQSASPSSPTPPTPPTKRSGTQKENSSAPPLPRSIIVPNFDAVNDDIYKHMIENRSIKDQGIPSEVLTIRSNSTTRKKRKKKKKRVRFHKPLITETKYRPKTPREDVDALYFQESELLDWEKDEMTTLRDRFEISLSEFRNSNDELDEETEQTDSLLSFATPLISFHDSYSISFSDSSDSESTD